MKIFQNIANGILGVVFAVVAAILLCVFVPDVGVWVNDLLKPNEVEEVEEVRDYHVETPDWDSLTREAVAKEVHDKANAANPGDNEGMAGKVANAITNAAQGISDAVQELEATEISNPADKDVTVEDVANAAGAVVGAAENLVGTVTGKGGIKVSVVSDDEEAEEEKEEETEETSIEGVMYAPGVPAGKSSYVNFTPEIIEIEDEAEAKNIKDNTEYGDLGEDLDFDPLYYPYYSFLNDDGKALYRQIYANTRNLKTTFRPVKQVTMNALQTALLSVVFDHPEIFWLDTTFYQEYDYKGEAIKVRLSYYNSINDIPAAYREFKAAANEIVEAANTLPDNYTKELFIHDYLAEKLDYKRNPLDQSAYSAIVGNKTVCAGYAKAFQYLMQRLQIPTYLCVGYAGEMHAWNIVKLEDAYYNVDCTWDDQNPTSYDYFNLSDADNYMHQRMMNSVYLPACNGEKFFVVMNGE